MTDISVRVQGAEHRFSPEQQPITIGRGATSSLVVNAPAISSTHATLTFEGGQWVYRDQSTNGTYVNNTPVKDFSIAAPVTVVLGNFEQGAVIEVSPLTASPTAAPPLAPGGVPAPSAPGPFAPGSPAPPFVPPSPSPGAPQGPPSGQSPGPMPGPELAGAMAPAGGPAGGAKVSSIHAETQMMPKELGGAPPQAYPGQTAGRDVRIQYEGGEFVAHPGQTITFGRDPSNNVHLDNPTVSRYHAQLTYGPKGWMLDDAGSARGLTVDGQSVRHVDLQGSTDVWFGPEQAGVRVIFAAPGVTKKKGGGVSPVAVIVPVAAVLLIALAAIIIVARSNSSTQAGPGNTTAPQVDLVALKKGTVRVEVRFKLSGDVKRAVDEEKRKKGLPLDAPEAFGSGTIISPDGLVLTNAHVATPGEVEREGRKLPPVESIKVARNVNGGDEQLTELEDAELVVTDPKIDLAIIRIVGASNLPFIPIGNDADVKAGEDIFVLGFPGTADTKAVTVTAGKASSFIPDKKLAVERAWINTDAKVEQGNSGGLAATRDGKIMGVPTAACFEPITESSGGPIAGQNRIRAIDLAQDLIAAAKSNPDSYETKSPDEDICATGRGS